MTSSILVQFGSYQLCPAGGSRTATSTLNIRNRFHVVVFWASGFFWISLHLSSLHALPLFGEVTPVFPLAPDQDIPGVFGVLGAPGGHVFSPTAHNDLEPTHTHTHIHI